MKLPKLHISRSQDETLASITSFVRAAIVITCLALLLFGCEAKIGDVGGKPSTTLAPNQIRIGDQVITAPAGASVEFESESEASQGSGIEKHEGSASGKGAGLTTDSEKAANNFNTSAPNSWLPGIGSTGGSADIQSTLTGGSRTSPLLWAGILACVGAAVAFYFGLRRAALVCVGLGAAFIAASFIPAWGWIILALAGVGAVGFYVWAERKNLLNREALRAVVAGVESLPDAERKAAKSAVSVHADEKDKATIKAIKKADDLPTERA